MSIIRNYEKYIRHQLLKRNAAISDADEFKILKAGTAAAVNPDLNVPDKYNHYVEWSIGDYTGYTRVMRRDLTAFWKEMHNVEYERKLVIRTPRATCIHDILKDINEFTLLGLKETDVVNAPLADGKYTEISISVTPECFWFTGSLKIPLQHETVIDGGAVHTKLPLSFKINECRVDPSASTEDKRFNGNILLYSKDFVKSTNALLSIVPPSLFLNNASYFIDSASANKIISALNTEADITAYYTGTANYAGLNLYGAQVVYNGPVEGYNDLYVLANVPAKTKQFGAVISKLNKPRQDLEFVLVIVPNPQYSNILNYEPIFIHYGNPKPEQVSRPPVHHWPLKTDRLNRGTDPAKPRFLARGDFTTRQFGGKPTFVLNQGNTGGPSGKYITPIGAELPTDGDWTISFDACPNYYKTTISTRFNFTSVAPDSTDRPQIYFNISGLGDIVATFDIGKPSLTVTYPANSIRSWPHWITYTMVRRGDRLSIYKDGLLAVVYHGVGDSFTSFNSLMTYTANAAPSFKELRYFDYALDAQQVKDAIIGKLDVAPVIEQVEELPAPVYQWSLDGHTESIGTNKTPLAQIFSFRDDAKITDGKLVACNTIPGGSKLGVSLDVSKDFTLSFDTGIYNALNNAGVLGDMFSGNGTHKLSFNGTGITLAGGGNWDIGQSTDPLVNNVTNQLLHYALVRRGEWVSIYLNGLYLRSQRWLDSNTTYWDHFGGPVTLDNRVLLRNVTYYDRPLTEAQLLEDVIDRIGKYVETGPVSIPQPLHNWQLQEDGINSGSSRLQMTAPFKFVDFIGSKWATLAGGRNPQAFGDGIEMPRTGDWVLDFELAVTGGPERNALFVTHLNKPWNGYPSIIALAYNKPYEVYGGNPNPNTVIQNNTASRITLRCVGGMTTMYVNGEFSLTYANPTTESFKGFRTTDGTDWFPWQMPENSTFIRNIRFWDKGLSKRQLDALLKGGIPANPSEPLYHWELNGDLTPTAGTTHLADGAFDWIEHEGKVWGYHKSNRVADLGVMLPTGKDSTFQFRMKLIKQPTALWCGLFGNTGTSTTNDPARIKITSDTWTGTEKPIGYRPYAGLNAPTWMLSPQLNFGIGVESLITMRRSGRLIEMFKDGVKYMTFSEDGHSSGITKVGASKEWMTDGVLIRDIKYWDHAVRIIPD